MRMRDGIAVVAVLVLTSGCLEQSERGGKKPPPPPTSSITTTPSSTKPAPVKATRPTLPTAAPAFGYTPKREPVKGKQGKVEYAVALPQLDGGQEQVRARFNSGMRTSLDDLIKQLDKPDVETASISDMEAGKAAETSTVTTITERVVAGIAFYIWYSGGAHPNGSVATIVINTATAQPILFADVFPDQNAAVERLKKVVPELSDPQRPLTVNGPLLHWLPVPEGLRFYVPVSHALGDFAPVTVPWAKIRDLVAPDVLKVLT